jgi:hypothetical protein
MGSVHLSRFDARPAAGAGGRNEWRSVSNIDCRLWAPPMIAQVRRLKLAPGHFDVIRRSASHCDPHLPGQLGIDEGEPGLQRGGLRSWCWRFSRKEKVMNFVRVCFRAAVAAPMILILGCSSAAAPPKAEAARAAKGEAPSKEGPAGGARASNDAATPPRGATGVEAPKFSTDPCEKDKDCAPVAMCHPDKCVAQANVGTMSSEMLCSMECREGTVDCADNHCGCAASPSGKKLCALLPGPGEKR